MPAGSQLAAALAAASPPSQLAQRLREAASTSTVWGYSSGSDDDEADAQADRIIAENRERREAEQKKKDEEEKAAAEAAASVPDVDASHLSHLGHAAKAAFMKRTQQRREDQRKSVLASIAEQALMEARKRSGAASVLTDLDYLSILMEMREAEYLGRLPTEAGLRGFCSVASVCKTWREACMQILDKRVVLRHAHMLIEAPKPICGFVRPAFLTLTLDEEHLLVSDQHKVSMLPVPLAVSALEEVSVSTLNGQKFSATSEERSNPTGAIRTLGASGGHGGDKPGELYHPHGVALTSDGEACFVSDRSNHRIQCLRLSDGASLDCTLPGTVWGPYDLCLLAQQNKLLVCDANNDRILTLNAKALTDPPLASFGRNGADVGELDRPRGIAPLGEEAEEVVIAEFGNNRCSVWKPATGECVRTFGDEVTADGSLPLRQPFGVLFAHNLLLVSEMEGRRLCVFDRNGSPLQMLSPKQCGGLGGLIADSEWIYCLDAQKGYVLSFTTKKLMPLGTKRELSPLQVMRKKQRLLQLTKAAEAAQAAEEARDAAKRMEELARAKQEAATEELFLPGGRSEASRRKASMEAAEGEAGPSSTPRAEPATEAERYLLDWIAKHEEDPVPSLAEKRQLAQATGMSQKEVSAWFQNHRKEEKARVEAEARQAAGASAAADAESERVRRLAERMAEQLSVRSAEPDFMRASVNMSEY